MTTVYPLTNENNAPNDKAQMVSNWFLEHYSEFPVLKWLPDLNPIRHLLDMDKREPNLQELCDSTMLI